MDLSTLERLENILIETGCARLLLSYEKSWKAWGFAENELTYTKLQLPSSAYEYGLSTASVNNQTDVESDILHSVDY